MLAKRLSVLVFSLFVVQTAFAQTADWTVSKPGGDGQFNTINEALDAARTSPTRGGIIEIMDDGVYEEQVVIDSTLHGITLRSSNPEGPDKPTILFRDTENKGPENAEEAKMDGMITFDQNGALVLKRVQGVTIDGIIVDGESPFVFGYNNVWYNEEADEYSPLLHGNAAITLYIAGDAVIRNCEVRNAYFGFNVKDRNTGGVFGNPNPSDNDHTIPMSGFGKTGHHLIEHNRIHSNSFGFLFESTWDRGSTIRYNLIYNNFHTEDTQDQLKSITATGEHGSEKVNQPGGAFMFKDGYLSPLAIYNNTLWQNYLIIMAHWHSGGQHLIFNNIIGRPKFFWGKGYSYGEDYREPWYAQYFPKALINRMKHTVLAGQKQENEPSEGQIQFQCDNTQETFPVYHSVQMMNGMGEPQRSTIMVEHECPDGEIVIEESQEYIFPGGLLSAGGQGEDFPDDAELRWLETDELFVSTDPSDPQFLHPKWDHPDVIKFIKNKGWPEAGIRNADGQIADLGAIPSDGSLDKPVVRIKPTNIVFVDGTNATVSFDVDVLDGTFNNPTIKYIRWIHEIPFVENQMGDGIPPVPAEDIVDVPVPSDPVKVGGNDLIFTVPERTEENEYAFFEIVLEGENGSGETVSSDVGFLPFRTLSERFEVEVQDLDGKELTQVVAGQKVKLIMKPEQKQGDTWNSFEHKLDTVAVNLTSGSDAILFDANTDSELINPVVEFGLGEAEVYFTKAGSENVMANGRYQELVFMGSTSIEVLPGAPEKIAFQKPTEHVDGVRPPWIRPGEGYPVEVLVMDKYDNPVIDPAPVSIVSRDENIGAFEGSTSTTTDSSGIAHFTAVVTNGILGDVLDMDATLEAATNPTSHGALMVARSTAKLKLFYGDTLEADDDAEIQGVCGVRYPVVIRAMQQQNILTDKNIEFTISSAASGIEAFASETAADSSMVFDLVDGEARIWITGNRAISNGFLEVSATNDNEVQSGDRENIYFELNISLVDYGVAYADDGWGRLNRLEVYYLDTLTAETLPDSVVMFWPDENGERRVAYTESITLDENDSKHITVVFDEPFPEAITTFDGTSRLGTAYYWDPNTPSEPTQESVFSVTDSIGPLIESATLVERIGEGVDTLLVEFTEGLADPLVNLEGGSLQLVKGETDTTVLNILEATVSEGMYKVVVENGEAIPQKGDLIRFNPAHSITDLPGNPVHANNRSVPLGLRISPPKIVSAFYHDKNADGIVDSATIVCNKIVNASDVKKMVLEWGRDVSDSLGESRFSQNSDSTMIGVDLAGAFPGVDIRTDNSMQLEMYFEQFDTPVKALVSDGAAPVLMSATLKVGGVSETGEGLKDTLVLVYSEGISDTAEGVNLRYFNLRQGETVFTPVLNYSGKRTEDGALSYFYLIEDLVFDGYPEAGDSVFINSLANFRDGTDFQNAQTNELNRRVPLKIKAAPIGLNVTVKRNPFKFGDNIYFEEVGRHSGVLVEIDPVVKLRDFVKLEATVAVYDNLGNVVLSETVEPTDGNPILYWEWDGYNKFGRAVGTGSYIAIFDITKTTESTEQSEKEVIQKTIAVVR